MEEKFINEIIKEYLQENPFVMPDPPPGGIRLNGKNYKYHFKYDNAEHFEKRRPDLANDYSWKRMKPNIKENDELRMLGDNDGVIVTIIRDGKIPRDPAHGHLDCNTFMCVGVIC